MLVHSFIFALAAGHAMASVEKLSERVLKRQRLGEVYAGAPTNGINVTAAGVDQCGEATISWTGTTPPVTLMVGTGGYYVGITTFSTIPGISDPSTTVFIDRPAGEDLIFQVTDANGNVGYVQNVPVGAGTGDTSCLASDDAGDASSSGPASSAGSGAGAGAGAGVSVSATSAAPSPSLSSKQGTSTAMSSKTASGLTIHMPSSTSSKSRAPKSASSSSASATGTAGAEVVTITSGSASASASGANVSLAQAGGGSTSRVSSAERNGMGTGLGLGLVSLLSISVLAWFL